MQRNITIELGERDATLAAESLDEHGQSLLTMVDRWRSHPIEVEWDPQEKFEEGVRLCSVAIQLWVALAWGQAGDTVSPVTEPMAGPSGSAGRYETVADNGDRVTHRWRVGDEVHHIAYGWNDDWRGSIIRLVDKHTVAVAWRDGIPTHSRVGNLEPDDGRQS